MSGVEIPNWLKKLPLAPEFYPTETEFADPIAYISKIEKEASAFGICKVIPPLPKPSKKYTYSNLNKSLSKFPDLGSDLNSALASSSSGSSSGVKNGDAKAVFTTRHQELGYGSKRYKGSVRQSAIHKQVWQSGEVYTLEQFETKSKIFAKNQLGTVKDVTPLIVEALFWKTSSEKPIYVEYANDVPGSGFGEPDFPNRYFHKPQRKRKFSRNHRRNLSCEKREIDTEGTSSIGKDNENSMKIDFDPSFETCKSPSSASMLSDGCQRLSKSKSLDAGSDREGSAGWKLSNCPWNLQVIARSPGSLTRFMLEDIPGVTSPMIYIGMLYSWFAWHVEDHELHSLNYLHTGSPKTWYAVPGDRAVAFEEIVCSQGYGGNIDRLAALTLLGEKTNLLSPEVVVASGLSCCRLVQYPGEFVVTFPRAYHVGFSHGFNCGEAANFGTPQWLKVAKEAAVRRAAMDLLPMLSHQQLLYMLTVSFISRVPRALVLPGARSSRLRDRQKEERELVVKKAFIDDMVSESNLLLEFLGKQSTSYAVTWDPELLPSTIKDSQSSPSPSTFSESCLLVDGERDSDTRNLADENIVGSCENPVSRTDLSLETGEGLYENENEFPCGLHLDSGALVCVACGILGFPFMSIVQPSHCASEKLLRLADSQMVQEGQELLRSMKPLSPFVLDHTINKSSDTQDEENQEIASLKHNDHILIDTAYNGRNFGSVDVDRDTKGPPMHPDDKVDGKWSRVNGFLRPRIFCLEHGLEIKEMLHSKGGAEVLIICHSAYQKIKSHASAVSEEIGVSFNCKEVPLKCASQEDLKLINIAIDSEEHEEGGEDWTSGIGINLQHRVKLKKLFPSKQDNYALVLRGLFPEKTPNMDISSLRWNSKKIRTPVMTTGLIHYKLCGKIQIKEVKQVEISARNKVISDSGPIQTKSGKNLQVKEDIPLDISGINKVTVATSPNLSELCENNHTKEDKAMVVSEGNSVNGKTNLRLFVSWDNSQTKEEKLVEILGMGSNIQAKSPRKFKLCDNTQIEEDQSMEVSDRNKVSQENTIILYSRRARNKKTGFPSQPSSSLNVLPRARTDAPKESFAANGTLDNNRIQSDDNLGGAGNTTIYGMELVRFPVMKNCKFKSRDCTTTETRDISEESDPSKFAGPLIAENVSIELSVAQSDVVSITEDNRCVCKAPDFKSPDKQGTDILANKSSEKPSENRNLEETDIEDKDCNYAVMDVSEMQQEGKTVAIESNQLMVMDVPETQHEGKASADESVVCNDAYSAVAEKGPACAVTKISEMQLEAETSSPKPMVFHQANTMTMEKGWEDVIMDSIEVLHEDKTATYESNQPISLVMRNPGMQQEGKAWAKESATCCQANPFCQPKISVLVNESSEVLQDIQVVEEAGVGGSVGEDMESKNTLPTAADPKPAKRERNKRSRELHQITKDQISFDGFTRGPCEGLRPRNSRTTAVYRTDSDFSVPEEVPKKLRKQAYNGVTHSGKNEIVKEAFACNIERCQMRFKTKTQLVLHKQNQCTHKGCGKTFSSHKKVILHQRVHAEERPLKCSWQGCNMSFKWAWARTEHLRLHTGERPYECKVSGCGLTFRFVSDYSRHRRKTGHYVNSP